MRQLLSVEFEKKQICQLATWRIWRLQGLAEPLSWVEGLAQGQIHADNLGNIRDRGALRGAGDLLDALRGPPAAGDCTKPGFFLSPFSIRHGQPPDEPPSPPETPGGRRKPLPRAKDGVDGGAKHKISDGRDGKAEPKGCKIEIGREVHC
jgi:hypothetical protein